MQQEQKPVSPFLRIPLELRRLVYSHLLTPVGNITNRSGRVQDYYGYEASKGATDLSRKVLMLRSSSLEKDMILRSKYKIRSGRLRSACEDASYYCPLRPSMSTSIFRVNRQIHDEAAEFLYGSYVFDFDTHIEACVPFLMDLTPFSRKCIRHLSIVKRALPYDKEFDRCEWSWMCEYISENMDLRELSLGVVAGKPASGWEEVQVLNEDNIAGIVASMEEMSWVDDLADLKGLEKLNVRACIEHSPPPMSSMMAFFVSFSASVTPHFADYLTARMIVQAA